MAYTPIQVTLGELPECPGQNVTYPLSGIPDSATEVLVYAFVTTHNDGPFQRGFYVLSTSGQGDTKYSQYLNVASGSPAVTVASANMWFPVGRKAKELNIQLVHPGDQKKSVAHKVSCEHAKDLATSEWSNVFILGYR